MNFEMNIDVEMMNFDYNFEMNFEINFDDELMNFDYVTSPQSCLIYK